MSECISITSSGTLHRIRDPEGTSFRFVSDNKNELVSAVLFQAGLLSEFEMEKYRNAKITVSIELEDSEKVLTIR